MTFDHPATDAELDAVEARIDGWLQRQLGENPILLAVDRGEPGERRWYVRLRGEEKDFTTIWLTLGQRTLQYETYVMPAPEENHATFYEHLLRRNAKLVGAQFCIGGENAVYLVGSVPDRVAGRRRARPHRGVGLRVRGAVLPTGPPHRVRLAISRPELRLDVSMHFMSFCTRPEGAEITGSGKSGDAVCPRVPRSPQSLTCPS